MLIIVVTVTLVRCAAQQNPVDDTRMYQFVRQDQRLFIRQGGKYSGIGMVTAVEQQGASRPKRLAISLPARYRP